MGSRFITVRDQRLSLWQSAVNEATDRLPSVDPAVKATMRRAADLHAQAAVNGLPIAKPARVAGAPLSLDDHVLLSRAHFDLAEARRTGDQARAEAAQAIIRDYSEYDPNWVTCVTLYNLYYNILDKQAVYYD